MASKRGRPIGTSSKCTPELTDAMCRDIEIGVPAKLAAEANDLDESTFYDWMRKGLAGTKPYAVFYRAVKRSRGRLARNLIARALAGGPGAAQALWLLERCFPEEFGKYVRISGISGADPTRIRNEVRTAELLRNSPAAVAQLHAALLTAFTDSASSLGAVIDGTT